MQKYILVLVVTLILSLTACTRMINETVAPATPPEQRITEAAPPTLPEVPATGTTAAQPPAPVVYYYFVAVAGSTFPEGSVVLVPNMLILAPTPSDTARSPDTATNIGSALQAMLNDPRNIWTSDDLNVTNVTFSKGHANIVLRGRISGAGDVVRIAARMQILMTVFAEASVQTATVTLNDESIGNLGISHNSEAKPADYVYTRAEIEAFMTENAYETP